MTLNGFLHKRLRWHKSLLANLRCSIIPRMLETLAPETTKCIDALLAGMSVKDKIGQLLCPVAWDYDEVACDKLIDRTLRRVEQYGVGCVFLAGGSEEATVKLTSRLSQVSDVPIIVCADMENGAGGPVAGRMVFPAGMACGAANDPAHVETVGRAVAREGRALGVHWTLGPVSDLCLCPANPMTFTRSYGCRPEHVGRMATAYIGGVQRGGRMSATAKHFPGDGAEEREPHICAAVNALSRDEWMDTYGRVWRAVIDAGVMTIMVGHIALPFVDGEADAMGLPPATLSRKIQVDFLRDELGFEGLTICDAASMPGIAGYTDPVERCWRNVAAGTDVHLFSEPETDSDGALAAVRDGKLTEERLTEAARRVLELKARVGLFSDAPEPETTPEERIGWQNTAQTIADNSIVVARNVGGRLPVMLGAASKVLTVTMLHTEGLRHGHVPDIPVVDEELRRRGISVRHEVNLFRDELRAIQGDYDAVFLNLCVRPRYGTTRMYGDMVMTLWKGYWREHPCVIFSSFGDPFKLQEIPYAPNWVMSFDDSEPSQRAMVKVWLGEMAAKGRCPVSLPGYFDAEV